MEPISNQLNELTDSLKKSRTHIHSFSRNTFVQVAAPGEEAEQRANEFARKAREEYKFRQVGLAASIGVIGLLMVTLYLKLRQMEKPRMIRLTRLRRDFFRSGAIFFFVLLLLFYAAALARDLLG